MKKKSQKLLTLFLSVFAFANISFAEKVGPDVDDLYYYFAERMDLPGLDAAGSGCQIEVLERTSEGYLNLTVRDLNHVMSVTLFNGGEERIGPYNGVDTSIVEYEYVFNRVLFAQTEEGEMKHLRLQKFNPETGEVFEQLDCVAFPLAQ
jgi:hypothetical protein